MKRLVLTFIGLVLLLSLSACGGGGGGGTTPTAKAPATAAAPTLKFAAVKTFRFTWKDVSDATYYKLLENPDGVSGFTQVGSDIPQGTQKVDHVVPLYARINAQYILESCNKTGCTDSSTVSVSGTLVAGIGYVKASNTGMGDLFGDSAVSLSADGDTLAVGAWGESSKAKGINSKGQSDNLASDSGAVYVFSRSGSTWSQQAYVKASNTGAGDYFGTAVSLSADGNTLAVGASREDSTATGIGGNETDNSATYSGAVYVFNRSGSTWSQQAYIKASNTGAGDDFGWAVSLSGDGSTLAVGARGESSAATGIGGIQSDNSMDSSGAVYMFSRSGATWSQQAYVKANNTSAGDIFGTAVSLSTDGNTLAVGADLTDTPLLGGGSVQNDGSVYLFSRSGTSWSQQAYVRASNYGANDEFGYAVSLSGDGNTLAVGAVGEASAATGIDGKQTDNSASGSGAVYVFSRSGATWSQQAYVKASNTEASDDFGVAVSLSTDGNTLAVGADSESSAATGIGGIQSDNLASGSGAVYVFSRSGATWSQQAYVKASNTGAGDNFGTAVSLSGDGTLAVGAFGESSATTGVGGNQTDNSVVGSGAAYLY